MVVAKWNRERYGNYLRIAAMWASEAGFAGSAGSAEDVVQYARFDHGARVARTRRQQSRLAQIESRIHA